MANILDYLDWRGDLTLAQDPFNEVDNLILAELSFVDFGGIVPGPGEGRAVPLWKAAEAYFAKTEGRPIDMGVLVPNQIPELLRRAAASPRFRDMKLNGFVDHLDTVKAEQFAALAAECGDGTVYLSFRGTDDTLAGWKEDFYLSCMREVPAQKMAVTYTEAMAHQYPRIKLRLGGHSKGGNLAVYAAMNAPEPVQRRVTAVYSLDGPGFPSQIVGSDPYRSVMPLIVKIVPDSSIVGMILETPEPMRVVRSDQKGVMQHLTFSWQVSGNDFEYLPQVSPSSQLFNRSLNGWLESLSTEDRERAVDALFSVLRSSHADSISDLMAAGLKAVPTMINTFVGLSEADRRHLIEAMGLLMAAVRSRSSR